VVVIIVVVLTLFVLFWDTIFQYLAGLIFT